MAGWASGLAGWPRGGGWTEGRTDVWTENLPILQDLVPMKTEEKVEQGKGTADHLMPLGYLFKVERDWRGEWRQRARTGRENRDN